MPKTLHLTLTYHWWDKVASGEKKAEYRRFTANWRKRLADVRPGDLVVFHRGYTNRTLTRRIEQIRVLDVFMGSGTTLVACEKLGLHGTGIEINEKYFDAACRRVEEVSHNR